MFIQVLQGKVRDQARLQDRMDLWVRDLMPGAIGYLGTTAGATADGMFIALARFESAEAARANSDRPEQGAWWAETAKCFDGEPTFMDCKDVTPWMGGGSDDAHFVQVMEGHTSNADRMLQIWSEFGDRVHEMRPEILGGSFMKVGDSGDYVEAIYFTNEDDARRGEQMEVPDDLRTLFEEDQALAGDVKYFDLKEPTLVTARR